MQKRTLRRIFGFLAIAAVLAGGVLVYRVTSPAEIDRRFNATESILRSPSPKLHLQNISFLEAFQRIESLSRLEIEVDWRALRTADIDPRTSFSFQVPIAEWKIVLPLNDQSRTPARVR